MKIRSYPHSRRSRWLTQPMGSGAYRHWLIDKGSLTQRLQSQTREFAVHPSKVCQAKPQGDEAHLLHNATRQTALLREVYLYGGHQPLIFAHSVLPYRSLRGAWQGLSRLGSKSLGTTLFADARVMRTPLEYKKLGRHHALYRKAASGLLGSALPETLWARRSVFRLRHGLILVTEVFLPAVLKL